jgi:hypothetical protein
MSFVKWYKAAFLLRLALFGCVHFSHIVRHVWLATSTKLKAEIISMIFYAHLCKGSSLVSFWCI